MGAGEPRDDLIETISIHSCIMEGEGVPIRFPAIAELEVDTVDRYRNTPDGFITALTNPTTSSSVIFEARQTLTSGYFTRIALSEIQFHYKTPNINPYNNNFAVIMSNFTPVPPTSTINGYLFPLDVGFYDIEQLGSSITARLNTTPEGPFIYTPINPNTEQEAIQIQCVNPSTLWAFSPAEIPGRPTQAGKFYKTAGISKLNIATGNPLINPGNLRNTQLFAQTANLAYTDYIDIVSDRLAKFAKVKDGMTRQYQGQSAVLARIYLTPFNTHERFQGTHPITLSIDYTTPKYIRWNPDEYINNFDLQLYDEFGNLVWCDPDNYPQYINEYQFTLQVSET